MVPIHTLHTVPPLKLWHIVKCAQLQSISYIFIYNEDMYNILSSASVDVCCTIFIMSRCGTISLINDEAQVYIVMDVSVP